MSRKFITAKEEAFNASIIKEFVQSFVGQEVYYYAISAEENRVKNVYGEQINKKWKPPVKINALVNYDDAGTKSTSLGLDSSYGLEVYFHTQELTERNVILAEGDFIEYAQVYFEISSISQPQLFFGQAQNKVMTKVVCVASREGQFSAGSISKEDIDASHQVNSTPAKSLGD